MEDFKLAQQGLDKLFDKLDHDRRTGENRAERRKREREERKAAKREKLPSL